MKKIELTENGFQVNYGGEISNFEWTEIKKLTGFKMDRITTDDICLKIESDNKTTYVSEEFEDWRKFINKLQNKFPQIDKNWEGNIATPAFERNETELYDRKKKRWISRL